MLYEFQVWFRDGDRPLAHDLVRAETPEEAVAELEKTGVQVASVNRKGLPIEDPNRRWYTKEEAHVYLRAKQTYEDSPSLLDKMMAADEVPKPKTGLGLWPRWILDRSRAKRMGIEMEDAA